MHLKSIHIENYRLLKNVIVNIDSSLTLFVGKNNTGKTSIMHLLELLCSGSAVSFDDYPLDCRQELYSAIIRYWNSESEKSIEDFIRDVPITKVCFTIDYSDGFLGNVSAFIIDLDENINEAVIRVEFDVSPEIESVLTMCKTQYDSVKESQTTDGDHYNRIQKIVRDWFPRFFTMKVVAVNPSNPEDHLEKSKADFQRLFFLKVISAERDMDESGKTNSNPLSRVMNEVFKNELEAIESGVQEPLLEIQKIVNLFNYNLQGQINFHMASIVHSMLPFGYPAADDLQLQANASIDLGSRITEDTELTYITRDASESLPSSHNGLGYKNLIKISLELHEFARELKKDRTRLPLLLLEEPEAHMHPQLQTTFVMFIESFLAQNVGAGDVVQVLMTTHSAHVANTVEFKKIRYILRRASYVECKDIAVFSDSGDDGQRNEIIDFLQKYMKLSYCDLYFCDKAILVEGASERLLLPNMINKCQRAGLFSGDIPLSSQYYTIVEVGGAYAHRFFDFLDYLEIPSLVLTDIDYAKANNKACIYEEATHSTNGAINSWCRKKLSFDRDAIVSISHIIGLTEEQRTDRFRHIEFETEEKGFHPRSLEDSIINCNRELFGLDNDVIPDFSGMGYKKTDFALKLLVEEPYTNYQVPAYIRNGLVWLNKQSRMGVQQHD